MAYSAGDWGIELVPISRWPLAALASALVISAILALAHAQSSPGFVGIFTNRYDIARDGLNPNETLLTPTNVTPQFFGKLSHTLR